MLLIRNKAAFDGGITYTAAEKAVAFDTTVYSTNNNAKLEDNAVKVAAVGMYDAFCQVELENAGSSAVTVTLQLTADGKAVSGASADMTIPATSTSTIPLEWAVNVVSANQGTAAIGWTIAGGAVTMLNAVARVYRFM